MDRGPDSNTSFLPLTEAAERLGISRLKLREAIAKGVVPARRDNQGDWRVDLLGVSDLSQTIKDVEADPQVLMGVLFDEIEALSVDLGVAEAERDRFATVTARALDAADAATTQVAGLRLTTDRAFGLLDQATFAVERARAEIAAKDRQITAQNGQIERLFNLSEQAVATAAQVRKPGLIARILGLSGPAKR